MRAGIMPADHSQALPSYQPLLRHHREQEVRVYGTTGLQQLSSGVACIDIIACLWWSTARIETVACSCLTSFLKPVQ
jgi:hypothetical protein